MIVTFFSSTLRSPNGTALAAVAAIAFVCEAAGLTVRSGGLARTVVLQRRGPTVLLVEPGPETLSIRELPPGADAAAALAEAFR